MERSYSTSRDGKHVTSSSYLTIYIAVVDSGLEHNLYENITFYGITTPM